jgi:hypothetical protein
VITTDPSGTWIGTRFLASRSSIGVGSGVKNRVDRRSAISSEGIRIPTSSAMRARRPSRATAGRRTPAINKVHRGPIATMMSDARKEPRPSPAM